MTVHHFAGFLYRSDGGRLIGLLGTVARTPTDWVATGRTGHNQPMRAVHGPTRDDAVRALLAVIGVDAAEWVGEDKP